METSMNASRCRKSYKDIKATVKVAFLCCFIFGIAVHLFAFTNIIPNSDGLSRVYDLQQMTVSGRWFLHYASSLSAYIQAPALIGMLSMLFLSLSASLTVDMLNIKSRLFAGIIGVMLAIFPSLAYTYLYMFTASAYTVGIFLAVLGVWLCGKYKFGFVPGILCIACATGVYQAYFAIAAALCVCVIAIDLAELKNKVKSVVTDALKLTAMLVLSGAAYYIILKLFLTVKHLKLLSYAGMDSVSISAASLIRGIVKAYKETLLYFIKPGSSSYVTSSAVAFNILLTASFIAVIAAFIIKCFNHRQLARAVVLVATLAVMPLACNVMSVISDSTPLTKFPMVFVYVLMLAMLSRRLENSEFSLFSAKSMIALVCAFIVLISAQTANIAYTASATAHRATQVFASNLVARVESLDGYKNGMEVVVIGSFPDEIYSNDIEIFTRTEHYSCLSASVLPLNKHIYYYLNDWLNVKWQEPSEETFIKISNSKQFKDMPLYPDDGSVKLIGGKVVVRLAREYTPKQQFELDYEKRR